MKTAWKVVLGLTLICVVSGCCSWCGQGTSVCRTTAPGWDTCPTPTATAPSMSVTRPIVPQTTTLAGTMTPPQVTMR